LQQPIAANAVREDGETAIFLGWPGNSSESETAANGTGRLGLSIERRHPSPETRQVFSPVVDAGDEAPDQVWMSRLD
jgi:hypothetical protein